MRGRHRSVVSQVYGVVLGIAVLAMPASAHSSSSLLLQQRPAETLCRTQLNWHVGSIDPRFGFSRRDVITATLSAAEMWNQAAETALFEAGNDQPDAISIRLVYDHRQQLQDYIAEKDEQIARLLEQLDSLDANLSTERNQLADMREDMEATNQRIARKAEQVDQLIEQHANRQGQVSRPVAQQINELQSAAQQVIDAYNAKLGQFNQRQASFNASVDMRNRVAEQQSTLVAQRNQTVQGREADWQRQGLGVESGRHQIHIRTSNRGVSVTNETITIYSASNELGLATILAHELGHAIGIDHVPGHASIMSARLESTTPGAYPQQLSQDDLQALQAACQR